MRGSPGDSSPSPPRVDTALRTHRPGCSEPRQTEDAAGGRFEEARSPRPAAPDRKASWRDSPAPRRIPAAGRSPPEGLLRRVQFAQLAQRGTEIAVRARVVWLDPKRFTVRVDRFVAAAQPREQRAVRDAGVGVCRRSAQVGAAGHAPRRPDRPTPAGASRRETNRRRPRRRVRSRRHAERRSHSSPFQLHQRSPDRSDGGCPRSRSFCPKQPYTRIPRAVEAATVPSPAKIVRREQPEWRAHARCGMCDGSIHRHHEVECADDRCRVGIVRNRPHAVNHVERARCKFVDIRLEAKPRDSRAGVAEGCDHFGGERSALVTRPLWIASPCQADLESGGGGYAPTPQSPMSRDRAEGTRRRV